MTIPTGFPDWQNVPAWHAQAFQPATTSIPAATTKVLEDFDAGNYGSVTFRFHLNFGSIMLHIYTQVAAGALSPRETHRYIMGPETEIIVTIPLRGAAILVTADGAAAIASEINYDVFVSNTGVERTSYVGPLDHFSEGGATLGPGVFVEHFPPFLLPGPAMLSFNATGAAGVVTPQIRSKSFTGVPERVLMLFPPSPVPWNAEFFAPATRWCIRVTNNDVVNQNYGFGIVQNGGNI